MRKKNSNQSLNYKTYGGKKELFLCRVEEHTHDYIVIYGKDRGVQYRELAFSLKKTYDSKQKRS